VIHAQDRAVVIAVATQMWCARIQAYESRRPNGEMKHGYSPDMEMCVGEAAALVNLVDRHLPPHERPNPVVGVSGERRKGATIQAEITLRR
jgi:hypothetical protein